MAMQRNSHATRALERVWFIALGFIAISLLLFLALGFRFPVVPAILGGLQLLAGAGCALWLLRLPAGWKAGAIMSGWLQYAMISGAAAMLAFCAATLSRPWADEALIAADRAMGYDWQAYAQLAADLPWLNLLLQIAYYSLIFQPAVICFALPFTGRLERLAIYQKATLVALIVTIAAFAAFPVTTAWAYSGGADLARATKLHLIGTETGWIRQLVEIRAGRGRLVDWDIDARIIGFPSFHCAAALLNCWALWSLRPLRFGAIALNAVLIAATPLVGGHYVADLLAGGVVALASVIVAKRISRWMELRHSSRERPPTAFSDPMPA
jgi:hypothetical protein